MNLFLSSILVPTEPFASHIKSESLEPSRWKPWLKNAPRTGASLLWGRAERLFSLEKGRQLRGVLLMYISIWREGAKMMEPGSFWWCPVTNSDYGHKLKHRKFPLTVRKLTAGDDQVLAQISWGGDIPNLVNWLWVALLEQASWSRWPLEVSSNFSSVIM